MDSAPVGPRFPDWLRTQKNIEELSMSNSSISDTTPNWFEIVKPPMIYLDLSNNQIRGKLPDFEEATYSGGQIHLKSNNFQGSLKSIPLNIYAFVLSHNSLTGEIPRPKGNLANSSLTHLMLNDNNFNGSIPSILCSIQSLKVLDLSSNQLSGKIPACLGNLKELLVLNLGNNALYGQVPSSLGNLAGLSLLYLNKNNFDGTLPLALQNLKNLVILDLGENRLKDIIPRWVDARFAYLCLFRLQSNSFYGDIPLQLCQLSSLQVLNVAQNNLTGHIPRCFGNLSSMTRDKHFEYRIFVDLSPYDPKFGNPTKGRDLQYYCSSNLRHVKSVTFSENNIYGEIPKELMDLVGLVSLNFSRNLLWGRIHEKIGGMKKLESLDLSWNNLSGPIPPSLGTIYTLSYLNLSFNNLSGPIPQGNQLQTLDDKSIYKGNKGLCGKPLAEKCSKGNESHVLPLKGGNKSNISWFYAGIGPGFAVGLVGVSLVLFFKKSWRYAYFGFVENICIQLWIIIVVKCSPIWKKFQH